MSALTHDQQVEVRRIRAEFPSVGYRQIAKQLGVPEGRVRWFLSNDTVSYSLEPFRAYVWDLETTNLRADIGTLIVASFLDVNSGVTETRTIYSFEGTRRDRERQLVEWASERYTEADLLIGHNSLAFDKNFLNGVRARHGLGELPTAVHADTLMIARYGLKGLLQSNSLANLLDFFGLPVQKDKPSKHDWREANLLDEEAVARIAERCEADVLGQALLWQRLKPYWKTWKGQR